MRDAYRDYIEAIYWNRISKFERVECFFSSSQKQQLLFPSLTLEILETIFSFSKGEVSNNFLYYILNLPKLFRDL